MNRILDHISQTFIQSYDIDVSKYDHLYLNDTIHKRLLLTNCHSVESYAKLLEINKEEGAKFIHSLQNSYSAFFRNSYTFSVLERIVLPELINKLKKEKKNELRVWSAACAAGEEAYSLAILLEELCSHENQIINYRIFATDQNEEKLLQAQKGEYEESDLKNISLARYRKWFKQNGGIYTIDQAFAQHIYFSKFDLLSNQFTSPPSSIYGEFDIVFCANLLFYYEFEFQKVILEKTTNCLVNGGYIIVGESEREIMIKLNYSEVIVQSGIFKNKNKY